MKRFLFAIACISFLIYLVSSCKIAFGSTTLTKISVQGDHIVYKDLQELSNDSELIVIGEPLNNIEKDEAVVKYYTGRYANPERKSIEFFYTRRLVKIDKVLKGELSKNSLNIGEIAAIVDDASGKVIMIPSDYSSVLKGKRYIFFLSKGYTGDYFINGVNQGKFNIDGKDINETAPVELKKEVLEHYAKEY